jgi:hypothetical protein
VGSEDGLSLVLQACDVSFTASPCNQPIITLCQEALPHCTPPCPHPSASCLVARAAGKPSCWPMGTQARSGVGAAAQTLLAAVQPNGFQKATCNQPAPASAGLQRGQPSMTWALPGCMQHRHLHPLQSHTQRAAPSRRLQQSAHHIHPALRMRMSSASPTGA